MLATLIPHPLTPCAALERIEVEVARPSASELTLTFAVIGAIGDVRFPPPGALARVDELWRTTCFEAFVRAPAGEAYLELNFAPSNQWAAYHFDRYRAGMTEAHGIIRPSIRARTDDSRFELQVSIGLGDFSPAYFALSAVIEETSGVKSYWALAHPEGKPDFHHSAGFVLNLAAPERS